MGTQKMEGTLRCSVIIVTGSVGSGKTACTKHLVSTLPAGAVPAVIGAQPVTTDPVLNLLFRHTICLNACGS